MEVRGATLDRQSYSCAMNALQVLLYVFISSCRDIEIFIHSIPYSS